MGALWGLCEAVSLWGFLGAVLARIIEGTGSAWIGLKYGVSFGFLILFSLVWFSYRKTDVVISFCKEIEKAREDQ